MCFLRLLLGPDGHFGWWDGDIWSSENSQRVADAYSFSHIIHGMLFYGFLWLVARRLPVKYRFLIALLIEGGWELLENSPFIINRYREATIALGYVGDSVLNSVCDIGMMALGFLAARFTRVWAIVATIIVLELGCLWWVSRQPDAQRADVCPSRPVRQGVAVRGALEPYRPTRPINNKLFYHEDTKSTKKH